MMVTKGTLFNILMYVMPVMRAILLFTAFQYDSVTESNPLNIRVLVFMLM